MIHLPASVRVYLCLTPCDMRKSLAPARKHKQVSGEGVQLQVLPDQRMQAVEAQEGTYAVPYGGGAERRREITAQELGAPRRSATTPPNLF